MSDGSGDTVGSPSRTEMGRTSAEPNGDRAGLAAHILEPSHSGSDIGDPDRRSSHEQRLKQAENVADQVMMIRRRNRSYQPTQEQLNAVYDAGMVWVDYSLGRYGLMSRVEYRNYSSVALAKTELLRRKSVVEQTEATRRGISKRQCCVVM